MSKYSINKDEKFILSEESANAEVKKFLTYYDIDIDSTTDEKIVTMFERSLDAVTRYVRRGVLEIAEDADGKVTVIHHIPKAEPIVYGELGAKHKLAMDRVPAEESYRRIYALMGSLCGLGQSAIEKMSAKDLAVVEVLGTVFSNA